MVVFDESLSLCHLVSPFPGLVRVVCVVVGCWLGLFAFCFMVPDLSFLHGV